MAHLKPREAQERLAALVMPAVARLDRLGYQWLEERLAGHGISLAEFRIVGALLGERDGLRQGELARRLDIKSPTLSAALPKLERAGVLERLDDPEDARAWRIRLREGVPRLAAVLGLIEELDEILFQELSQKERAALRARLERASARLAGRR